MRMERTHTGNIPGIGQWSAPTTGLSARITFEKVLKRFRKLLAACERFRRSLPRRRVVRSAEARVVNRSAPLLTLGGGIRQVWNLEANEYKAQLKGHSGTVTTVAYNLPPDRENLNPYDDGLQEIAGLLLASGGVDKTVKVCLARGRANAPHRWAFRSSCSR